MRTHLCYECFVLDQREGAGCDEDILIKANGGAYRGAWPNLLYLPRRLQVSGTPVKVLFAVTFFFALTDPEASYVIHVYVTSVFLYSRPKSWVSIHLRSVWLWRSLRTNPASSRAIALSRTLT